MNESYKNKSREDLLLICKGKLANGRTFEELTYFLNRHEIDGDTQKFIMGELEKYEHELKAVQTVKKPLTFSPMHMLIGILLIVLSMIVLLIGGMRMGSNFIMAALCAVVGIVFIGIEVTKTVINIFRKE